LFNGGCELFDELFYLIEGRISTLFNARGQILDARRESIYAEAARASDGLGLVIFFGPDIIRAFSPAIPCRHRWPDGSGQNRQLAIVALLKGARYEPFYNSLPC
jgi:hypothetical protein